MSFRDYGVDRSEEIKEYKENIYYDSMELVALQNLEKELSGILNKPMHYHYDFVCRSNNKMGAKVLSTLHIQFDTLYNIEQL